MSDTTLGQQPPPGSSKDAIHIAVAPVTAADYLLPGQHVALNEQGQAYSTETDSIGIVDPFLTSRVDKGGLFWLCLYPKTTKNLRHDWDHPAFIQTKKGGEDVSSSTEWISEFAARWDYSMTEFMSAASQYISNSYELDDKWKQLEIDDDEWSLFWIHFHALTGISIGDKDKEFVRCCA